jgi:hypothetical protein
MMRRLLKHLSLFILYGSLGVLGTAIGLYVYALEQRPDLKPWHLADLDQEFEAKDSQEGFDFADYLDLEDRLFEQLNTEVYERVPVSERLRFQRYAAGSLADPQVQSPDWNRSFEMPRDNPRGAVLLLHGLSDSPYSMRALAELLHDAGFWCLGLRLPGHGTAPSGLVEAKWQDWAAATRFAAHHLQQRVGPDAPFFLVGYSNGAALAVEYSLSVLEGEALPRPAALILLSPAIGVAKIAAFAVWQARMGHLLGLEKLAWQDLLPEYDPYKYNSFAVNAGDQIYRLTSSIAARMDALNPGTGVENFPAVLAFLSVVDATIPPQTLIDRLFSKLAPQDHALVLFDINREADAQPLLVSDPGPLTARLLADPNLGFDLTLLTNLSPDSIALVAIHKRAQQSETSRKPLALQWPMGVISLAHVALPFPPDDPVYGSEADSEDTRLHLGRLEIRGERGLLLIPPGQQLRLRHNPFFGYLVERVLEFVDARTATVKLQDVSQTQSPTP